MPLELKNLTRQTLEQFLNEYQYDPNANPDVGIFRKELNLQWYDFLADNYGATKRGTAKLNALCYKKWHGGARIDFRQNCTRFWPGVSKLPASTNFD